jgi:hypothetical protein
MGSEAGKFTLSCLLLSPMLASAAADTPTQDASRPLQILASQQLVYDDDLFRLPADLSPAAAGLGQSASRQDLISSTSAGLNYKWTAGEQGALVNASTAYNRYAHNQQLDNLSVDAKGEFDWRLADKWFGAVGGSYDQALASFANNHYFAKDLLHTTGFYGDANWLVGYHFLLNANLHHTTTTHSVAVREYEDYVADYGGFGVSYATTAGNTFGWDYRYTRGSYPHNPLVGGLPFDQRYDENTSTFTVKYALTGKTVLDGSAGYLRHVYPESSSGNFSGVIWRADLTWSPGAKTQLIFSGGRQLAAYVDAESDYFVATSESVTAAWKPTEKLDFALKYARERDDYIGSNAGLLVADTRQETINSGQLSATWSPTRILQVMLWYRLEHRISTLTLFTYDDDLAGAQLRLTL